MHHQEQRNDLCSNRIFTDSHFYRPSWWLHQKRLFMWSKVRHTFPFSHSNLYGQKGENYNNNHHSDENAFGKSFESNAVMHTIVQEIVAREF